MTQKKENVFSILIGVCLLAAGAMAVFYAAYKVSYVSVDYGIHVDIVRELDWRHPLQMLREHPEPVWHLMVRAVMRIGGFSAERAAGLTSGALCAFTYLLAAYFLYGFLNGRSGPVMCFSQSRQNRQESSKVLPDGKTSERESEPGLSLPMTAIYTMLLSLSCAIFVPWFNDKPYLGQGSPNPWHNPTTIVVRPIGLLIFILVMGVCVRAQRAGFEKGSGLPVWKGILLALLLLLSNFSKPSFVQIFYPAIFVFMVLWLFVYRCRNFPLGMQLLVCCIPSVALMGAQFLIAFYGNSNSESAGIEIAPFKVAGLYTDNIALSTLLVLAFPLAVAICSLVRRAFDWTACFAWIMLFAGMGEKFLLAEGGSRMAHGNFNWGYILALYFVWFIAIRDHAAWKGNLFGPHAADAGTPYDEKGDMRRLKKGISVLAFAGCSLVLCAHFVSGLYYLYYLIVLGHGV